MFLRADKDLMVSDVTVVSKCAPKRNRCHPDDPAYERTVTQIQLTKVIDRLQRFALGENDAKGRPVIMTSDQVRASLIFLDKHIPNLKPVILKNFN